MPVTAVNFIPILITQIFYGPALVSQNLNTYWPSREMQFESYLMEITKLMQDDYFKN